MRPAEADLLLVEARKKLEIRGVSPTRTAQLPAGTLVPTEGLQGDNSAKPFLGWHEERPLLNTANRWGFDAFSDIQAAYRAGTDQALPQKRYQLCGTKEL